MKILKLFFIYALLITLFISCKCLKNHDKYNAVKTELFFGLSNSEGRISDEQWNNFKEIYLNKTFKGYTEIACNGFWINELNESFEEKCKTIVYLNSGNQNDSIAIAYVINSYKKLFNQESVLKIETNVKAAF